MKISLNTIRTFNQRYGCADEVAPDGVTALVEKIGAQLGAVEAVTAFGQKYDGTVIVRVVSCRKHPNADKLNICTIDDGGITPAVKRDKDGYVQVVCGAANVRPDLLVAWLPPGATVPSTAGKEPFALEAREIRGETSNGMLASPKELGLGDNHEGILEIDGDIKPGTTFTAAYNLQDDVIIDIENKMFTHRPDLFGFLGVARELAGIQGLPFKSPDWYTPRPQLPDREADELKLEFSNELPELVPRFTAITMRDVQVGPSPVWLQLELAKVGQKPINNIVDYTNYFMLLSGQPIHAYDYDKVRALSQADHAVLIVRHPKPGETIKLLNGKTIKPRAEAMMAATDKQLIGLGGAMGGTETEIDMDTKHIIIEAANWDMFNMRRTAMEHGVFTDAVTRFTKGQSPLQNLAVVQRIVAEIRQFAGGRVASPVIDDNHLDAAVMERQALHPPVSVTTDFINTRLGLDLGADDMKTLLENVEFRVETAARELTITAPFWRTDIELGEDIVEEIGRLYGFDKLPLTLPKRDLTPAIKDPLLERKSQIRQLLSKAGANEVLTYSFVPASLLERVGQDQTQAFEISNALSPDLQYYRLSLIPSLLEKVHPNIKAGYDEFALFEVGKTHELDQLSEEGLPVEFEHTGLVVTAADKLKKPGAAYFQAKHYLESLAGVALEFKPVPEAMQQSAVMQPYDTTRSAAVSVGGDFLGIIGEFKSSVRRNLKLPAFTAGFEVDTTRLGKLLAAGKAYSPLPRFPKITQDITLKVPTTVGYQQLYDFVMLTLTELRPDETSSLLRPVDIYQPKDDPQHARVTFRLTIASYARTLTDTEVNKLLDQVAAAAHAKLGAQRA